MNLIRLRRSRRYPEVGDIFVFQPKGRGWFWGLVVSTTATIGGFENSLLVYLYNVETQDFGSVPPLPPERLLIYPSGIDRTPWTQGYFQTVAKKDVTPDDRVAHCFKSILRERYYDDTGRLIERIDPHGLYAHGNYRTIDDEISAALGLPLSTDR